MPKEDIGLILLGVTGAFGVWSALNTSPVGTVTFGRDNFEVAHTSMLIGAGVIGTLALGIYALYGEKGKIAAVATGLTGVGLYLWYRQLLGASETPTY